jgi:hypothetical protein
MYKLTWNKVLKDNTIDLIEHPLNGCLIPKEQFSIEFEQLLIEFDGTTASDYFDFYFSRCPMNKISYKFRDDDTKEDFIDACIELNIIPSMKEILQGEMKEEQENRKTKSSEDLTNDFKRLKSKEMSQKYHSENSVKKHKEKEYKSKAHQIQTTYHSLIDKLEKCNDEQSRIKIEEKLTRVIQLMDHTI